MASHRSASNRVGWALASIVLVVALSLVSFVESFQTPRPTSSLPRHERAWWGQYAKRRDLFLSLLPPVVVERTCYA